MILKDKSKANIRASRLEQKTGRQHFVVPYQDAFLVTDRDPKEEERDRKDREVCNPHELTAIMAALAMRGLGASMVRPTIEIRGEKPCGRTL